MSTDDTQPAKPPAPGRQEPEQQSPPTVQSPAFRRPPPPPPPPPAPGAGRVPPGGTAQPQSGATPPAPPRPDPQPTRREVPPGATVADPAQAPYQQPGGQQAGYQPTEYQRAGFQQGGFAGAQQPQQPQYEPTRQWQPQDQPPGGAGQWPPQNQPAGGAGQWPPQDQPPGGAGQWPPVPPPGQARRGWRRPRRRRMRRSVMALLIVLVLLVLLVIGDRVALAITENEFASTFVSQGFPVKPSVDIEGFPFLTQLASKDFNKVDISASNVPAGPVTINSVHATINGMHISSFSSSASARVDHITATAFISFGSILSATGIGDIADVTVTQDGPDKLKLTASLGGIVSDTEEAQIKQTGPQTIEVSLLPSGGGLGSVLGSASSFSFSLPKGVPASLRITGLTLNNQGLTVSAAASNATFSK
jgi:hypothetical protein